MPFIMKKINYILTLTLCFYVTVNKAQTNNLTGSPYSLYGLGVFNEAKIGVTNSLGKSGIALGSEFEINNLNPASLAALRLKSFIFDVGFTTELNAYENRTSTDEKWRTNFSNIAMAFPVSKNSGMSLVLTPFTNVGYELVGITSNIEGTNQTYTSYVTGSGGLNTIAINYGTALLDRKLNVGISASYIFGAIDESETVTVDNSYLVTSKNTYYKNARLGLGVQFLPTDDFTFAATLQLPTSLKASQDRVVTKIVDVNQVEIANETGLEVDDFKLPTELSVGFKKTFWNSLTLNADYKKSFWSATKQTDNISTFKNQDAFGIGLEYFSKERSRKYFDKIRYRIGYAQDNGYIDINHNTIDSKSISAGIGLPLSVSNLSFINIGYTFGQRGKINSSLIKENYHLITLNLSLENKWFVKQKYN